jgi:hypothetical protein
MALLIDTFMALKRMKEFQVCQHYYNLHGDS